MKLSFLLIILSLLLSRNLTAQSLSQLKQGDSIIAGAGCSRGFYKDYAFKPKDINSYQHLKSNFGKDKFHVYFKGNVLADIKTDKTEIILAKDSLSQESLHTYNNLFLTDGKTTYYDDVKMQYVDPKNIIYVTDYRIPLFRSNNKIFYKGYLLDKLNANKISVIDSHPNENINFFTDGQFVYKNEILIKNADVKTFSRNGYVATNRVTGKLEDVADSRDNKNFYNNGEKIFPYPDWKETKLFPDSTYTKQNTVVFISEYETHEVNTKPVIDFYLSDNDFNQLTKNIMLQRKTELFLEKKPFLNDVKGYTIKVYKNKKLENTYFYEQDLEEWDFEQFTEINIVGDGFQFAKKDFDLIRQKGKPLKYLKEQFEDYKIWQQKIAEFNNNDNVIYVEPTSYYLSGVNKDGKQYKNSIYEYWLDDNKKIRSNFCSYDGLFTFKIDRKKAAEIMGGDIMRFSDEVTLIKKNKLIETILGKGNYFIHANYNTDHINKIEYLTFDIFCSKNFMQKVLPQYIEHNWQKILHEINWVEK